MKVIELIKKLQDMRDKIVKYDDEPRIDIGYRTKNGVTFEGFGMFISEGFNKESDISIVALNSEHPADDIEKL
ncbi:MAG: hypothetical protein QQN63_01940 [Nitrosopumilus sp.]